MGALLKVFSDDTGKYVQTEPLVFDTTFVWQDEYFLEFHLLFPILCYQNAVL